MQLFFVISEQIADSLVVDLNVGSSDHEGDLNTKASTS